MALDDVTGLGQLLAVQVEAAAGPDILSELDPGPEQE